VAVSTVRVPTLLLTTTLLLVAFDAQATNGYFSDGYGIKAEGVAGVGIAFPQDSLTIATNPAGLTVPDPGFDIGADVFLPRRSATLDQGGGTTEFDGNGTSTFVIPSMGFSYRINPQLVFGLALYGNGGLNTNYPINPYGRFGAQGSAGVNLEQAILAPALAYSITPDQSVGLALNVGWQRFSAKGIGLFSNFSSDPDAVSNRGNDDSSGAGVRLGWLGRFGPYVTLGATWQSKTYMGRFNKYAGLFADQGSFDIPATYGLGIAIKPLPDWTLALDWQRIQYSDVPAVGDGVDSLFAGVPLGATNGPGFGWRDVSVVKIGSSYRVNDQATLRVGFSTNQQPVPSSQTFFNILAPGVVRDHLTLGATFALSLKDEISFDYLHAFKNTVNGSGSIPPAFGGGEANVSLEENSFGAGYTHRF
jgi:long-chain fatty acid transport protein